MKVNLFTLCKRSTSALTFSLSSVLVSSLLAANTLANEALDMSGYVMLDHDSFDTAFL